VAENKLKKKRSVYKADPMRQARRKRAKMRKHVRDNPEDVHAQKEFDNRYGKNQARDAGLSARGRHKLEYKVRMFQKALNGGQILADVRGAEERA
jgi:hypothetical protein